MITVKGRCMKPRSRSIHLKQKQGRSTCRAQTRFLLCLQQDFEVEVWLSLQTIFFPWIYVCITWYPSTSVWLMCKVLVKMRRHCCARVFIVHRSPSLSFFFNHPVSLGLVTSKYVNLQTPETDMGTWRLIIPLRFPTGIPSSKGSMFQLTGGQAGRLVFFQLIQFSAPGRRVDWLTWLPSQVDMKQHVYIESWYKCSILIINVINIALYDTCVHSDGKTAFYSLDVWWLFEMSTVRFRRNNLFFVVITKHQAVETISQS